MAPIWALAARRVRESLGTRQMPLLALGAAFCFTVMMFNIPALGGTTAHPIAGTLLAVMLGPWAACIGISVALLIQALFFGDGGLLAYGANCFTMAFVLPFVGYAVYRLLAGRARSGGFRIPLSAAAGAFTGIVAASAVVAVLLGVQPALFHEPNGHALYFPFGLHITLPAMLATHLLVAGPAEAVVTAVVVRYLIAAGIPLYRRAAVASSDHPDAVAEAGDSQIKLASSIPAINDAADGSTLPGARKAARWARPQHWFRGSGRDARAPAKMGASARGDRRDFLGIGLLALVALTPLGLLARGEAWGEWDAAGVKDQLERRLGPGRGYTPKALNDAERNGYRGIPGLQNYASGDGKNQFGYLGAGLLGAGVITGLFFAGGRVLARRHVPEDSRKPGTVSDTDDQGRRDRAFAGDHDPQSTISSPDGRTKLPSHKIPPRTLQTGDNQGLPAWLCAKPDAHPQPIEANQKSNRFVERSLAEFSAAAAVGLQSDRWARAPGLLQRLDARGKVVTLLLLILITTLTRHPVVLTSLYLFAMTLGLASRLPLILLLRRVWLAVPIFVAAIALPLLFTSVTSGRELLVLWQAPHIALSRPGAILAGTLTLRVGTAVTFALLLSLTTRWNDLLQGLRGLLAPRLFLIVLAMTYRYLAVTLQTAADAFTARRSRTVGAQSNGDGRKYIGFSIGALFGKSLAMAEEVHGAMLSRGFRGEALTLARWRWQPLDTLWTLSILAVCAAAWVQG